MINCENKLSWKRKLNLQYSALPNIRYGKMPLEKRKYQTLVYLLLSNINDKLISIVFS